MEFLIGEIASDEINEAAALVQCEFAKFVAPDFLPQGITEFLNFVQPEIFSARLKSGDFAFCAWHSGRIVGFIEIRNYNHIVLLFVAEEFHRQGIAKKLLQAALSKCLENNYELDAITVNSSPFAAKIYEKMGFAPLGASLVRNGMRIVPMAKKIRTR